jgi:hypothetical protein
MGRRFDLAKCTFESDSRNEIRIAFELTVRFSNGWSRVYWL